VLDLLKLKTFLVVANRSSVTRAALDLGYSQSNVTAQIQGLERELGATLFERFTRKLVLTAPGLELIGYANRLLALERRARNAVVAQQDPAPSLALGAPETIVTYRFPDVLREFKTIYPLTRLNLVSGSNSAQQIEEVLEGTLDVAVVVDKLAANQELTVSCLGREEILMVQAAAHSLNGASDSFQGQPAATTILVAGDNSSFHLACSQFLRETRFATADIVGMGSIEAVKHGALAGMGIGVLPGMAIATELKDGRLKRVTMQGHAYTVHIQLIRHRKKRITRVLATLWNLIEQSLPEKQSRKDSTAGISGTNA
jgi:DNA-binding transcriptional LysR family regulator